MLRISVADVLLPTLTTSGRPVKKSRIQFQREVFSPRVLSLVMSLEGTMVLNSTIVNEQHSHVGVPFVQVGKGSVECDLRLRHLWIYWGDMRIGVGLGQGCPTLFLEIYCPVGFQSNPSLANLIQLVKVLLSR
jgi:hypothetical protein